MLFGTRCDKTFRQEVDLRKSVGPGRVLGPRYQDESYSWVWWGPDTEEECSYSWVCKGHRYQEESRRVFVSAPQRTVRPWKAELLRAAYCGCTEKVQSVKYTVAH